MQTNIVRTGGKSPSNAQSSSACSQSLRKYTYMIDAVCKRPCHSPPLCYIKVDDLPVQRGGGFEYTSLGILSAGGKSEYSGWLLQMHGHLSGQVYGESRRPNQPTSLKMTFILHAVKEKYLSQT